MITASHDSATKTVTVKVNDHDAFVNYDDDGQCLSVYHSFVPEHLRGKGLGRILAREAIGLLLSDRPEATIRLTCSYLQLYYRRHAKQDLDEDQLRRVSADE